MNDDRYYSQIDPNRNITRILVLSSVVAIHALILYCSPSAFSQNISPGRREILEKLLSSYNNISPYSMKYTSDTKILDKEGVSIKKRAALYRQEGIIRKSDKQTEVIYTAFKTEEKLNDLYQGEKLVPAVAGHTYWDRGENRKKLSYTDDLTPDTPEGKFAILWPDLKLAIGISPDATGWFADGVIVDGQHFSETLLNSNDLTVKFEKDSSGESMLHFEGSTPYGQLEVWVSDETQPQLQKASFVASDEFLKKEKMNRFDFDITILERTEIDGTFVVTKAKRLNFFEDSDGIAFSNEQIVNRSEIEFNPDFERAGAFNFDLPNGTVVLAYEGDSADRVKYLWQDGQLVPHIAVDIERAIEEVLESPDFPVVSKQSALPPKKSMPNVMDKLSKKEQLPEQAALTEARSKPDLFIAAVIIFVLVIIGAGFALYRYRVKNDAGE